MYNNLSILKAIQGYVPWVTLNHTFFSQRNMFFVMLERQRLKLKLSPATTLFGQSALGDADDDDIDVDIIIIIIVVVVIIIILMA